MHPINSIKTFNKKLDDIPQNLVQNTAWGILTIFMYFSGFMLLLFATMPNFVLTNHYYLALEPYSFYFLSQLTNVIFAFIFIGLARGIGSKVKKAFVPTAVVLLIAIINSIWKQNFPLTTCIISLIIVCCLLLSRKKLYRVKLTYSWGQIFTDAIVLTVATLLYLVMGIHSYFKTSFMHNAYEFLYPSHQAWLSGLIGFMIAILIVIIIYRYLAHQNIPWLNQPFDAKRVSNVINKYGGNEISHLAFMRDKQIYFYSEHHKDQLFFMFQRKANKIIVMGQPVGNQAKVSHAVDQFMDDADKAGFSLIFYEVGEKFAMLLHEKGFDFAKFGEEGFVDLPNITLKGSKHRGDRALMHKFQRNNYHFQIINPPYSDDMLKALKHISDDWLDGDNEKGFSLGFFDKYYLNQAPIAIMTDKHNKIVSFATLMPNGNHQVMSIDLMRSLKSAPSGIMDGILIDLFKYGQEHHYLSFNFGMAPLANVGRSRFSFLSERFAHLVFTYSYRFYNFKGLKDYKDKFVSIWKPRYIVYRKNNSRIFSALQLLLVVNRKVKK